MFILVVRSSHLDERPFEFVGYRHDVRAVLNYFVWWLLVWVVSVSSGRGNDSSVFYVVELMNFFFVGLFAKVSVDTCLLRICFCD